MKEIEQCCRTCVYYFQGLSCAPCTYCSNYSQWEEDPDLADSEEQEEER